MTTLYEVRDKALEALEKAEKATVHVDPAQRVEAYTAIAVAYARIYAADVARRKG